MSVNIKQKWSSWSRSSVLLEVNSNSCLPWKRKNRLSWIQRCWWFWVGSSVLLYKNSESLFHENGRMVLYRWFVDTPFHASYTALPLPLFPKWRFVLLIVYIIWCGLNSPTWVPKDTSRGFSGKLWSKVVPRDRWFIAGLRQQMGSIRPVLYRSARALQKKQALANAYPSCRSRCKHNPGHHQIIWRRGEMRLRVLSDAASVAQNY